ncbi:MAG: YjgP/YjgQ family permease, partial [Gemmatimonadetes bacterium]|nr:YjgP/YjgQ family permease [Gemmatimonadota bacterium]
MRIMSRYVVVQFAMPFGLSLLAFTTVFVVIDLVDRLSAFIDREVGLGTILSYYFCYLPYIVVLVLPMAVLLAGLFCMGGLIQRGELLAMKSAGISLYQVVIPLQILALGISILAAIMADQVVPRANRARSKIEQPRRSAVGPQSIRVQIALRDTGRRVLSMREYDAQAMKGRQVLLDKYKGGSLAERVRAEEAVWTAEEWHFINGDRRVFSDKKEFYRTFRVWAAKDITLTPEDLVRDVVPEDQMTYSELTDFIHRKSRNGSQTLRESVALHMRLAFPFANFVIALFGLPLASRMQRTGRPIQIG